MDIRKELLFVAKLIKAKPEYEYAWDPDHKNKPKGEGWEQTDAGWSRNTGKEEKPEKYWEGKNKEGEYYYDTIESEGDEGEKEEVQDEE